MSTGETAVAARSCGWPKNEVNVRLLLVDDDAGLRTLLRTTFEAVDVDVEEAETAARALEALRTRRPDAIVLDLVMPGLDGFGVLEHLQASPQTRWIPVVVLTAKTLAADEREFLKARTVSLLEKSRYSPNELRRLVEQALGASGS